ncbi:hypothetical protein [Massilia soli]|uniref:Secretion system X translation initiation factor n=1 Tax=Massilia soli TaxID=2792854 RepID=A0ABS7SM01_9BURK|nr:hypothetical protein [Massilia soli]MBZ2206855.1 hypothetical protein [Massilia soli]
MNRRVLIYGAALAGAAALFIFGDRTPDSGVAEAVERAPMPAAAPAAVARSAASSAPEPLILRVHDRAALLGDDDDAQAGAVFGSQDWNPPPVVQQEAPPPPPPPPSAPPLPFTFIGKAVSDGAVEVYLARSGTTYIVRENMVIDGTYRVDDISPPTLKLTYLPLNQVQQINIGVLE